MLFCILTYSSIIKGYLTTGDQELPGNNGLLDQIEAIRWVSANIGAFRGDANNVTIFGSSAGASSIGLLLITPATRGLFQSVILQSGSPIAFWATYNTTVDHRTFFRKAAVKLGCVFESFQENIQCLRRVPHRKVSDAHWTVCIHLCLLRNIPNFVTCEN